MTFDVGNDGKWGFTFTNYTAADKDLIVALPKEVYVNEDVTNHTHVNLAFNHMLARVQIVFYVDITDGHRLQIDKFSIPAYTQGTCVVTKDYTNTEETVVWTPATTSMYEFKGTEPDESTIVPSTANKVLFECYVIPQNNQTLKIPEIKIQTLNANGSPLHTNIFTDVSLALTGDHTSWQPGNIYSYQAEITSGAHEIHFKATVDSWDDPAGGDKNIGTVPPTNPSTPTP